MHLYSNILDDKDPDEKYVYQSQKKANFSINFCIKLYIFFIR